MEIVLVFLLLLVLWLLVWLLSKLANWRWENLKWKIFCVRVEQGRVNNISFYELKDIKRKDRALYINDYIEEIIEEALPQFSPFLQYFLGIDILLKSFWALFSRDITCIILFGCAVGFFLDTYSIIENVVFAIFVLGIALATFLYKKNDKERYYLHLQRKSSDIFVYNKFNAPQYFRYFFGITKGIFIFSLVLFFYSCSEDGQFLVIAAFQKVPITKLISLFIMNGVYFFTEK